MAHGGARKGAGRKAKDEEQALIERLSPLSDSAFVALSSAIKEEQSWAVKLFFEYMYGKPKETVTQTTTVQVPNLKWDDE